MQTLQSADKYYQQQQHIAAATAGLAKKHWRGMTDDFSTSWAQVAPVLIESVQLGRAAVVATSVGYTAAVLDETGQRASQFGTLNPEAFLSQAPNGQTMEDVLAGAVVQSKMAVKSGATSQEALAHAALWLTGVVLTVMADTGRSVVGVDIAQHPTLTGYTRMLNAPSCSRCVILAGKWFKWNEGFLRHPRCFPAGTLVSGPASAAASRRWYEGELVILHTASGQRLPVTGNHPILTDQGWVPANLLNEGYSVVRSTLSEGAAPLEVPNEQQSPALIEDVWGSGRMGGLSRVKTSPEDFHGDGSHGEVDVVFADRNLRSGIVSTSGEPVEHGALAALVNTPSTFPAFGVGDHSLEGQGDAANGIVGSLGLRGQFGAGHFASADLARIGVASDWYAGLDESTAQHISAHTELFSEAVLALSARVLRRNEIDGQDDVSPRWDAPSVPFTVESRSAYVERGEDLRLRLASQVELDRVVEVERVQWSGHVYNLTSSEGWYSANGLIVSNCDCRHIPASEDVAGDLRTDPYAYFNSLSKEAQEKVFGRSEARAINDGGDIYRVVNIKQNGLATARGHARYGTPSRMTVDDIYRTAGHRTNAIRMLEEQGYITGPQVRGGNILGNGPVAQGFGQLGKGGKARAATDSVLKANLTGVRDPLNRYTMTAAERRLFDAKTRLDIGRTGIYPRSIGKNTADKYVKPRAITPGELSTLETAFRNEVAKVPAAPQSVKRLARLLGI